jgi:hypothetical protein
VEEIRWFCSLTWGGRVGGSTDNDDPRPGVLVPVVTRVSTTLTFDVVEGCLGAGDVGGREGVLAAGGGGEGGGSGQEVYALALY